MATISFQWLTALINIDCLNLRTISEPYAVCTGEASRLVVSRLQYNCDHSGLVEKLGRLGGKIQFLHFPPDFAVGGDILLVSKPGVRTSPLSFDQI